MSKRVLLTTALMIAILACTSGCSSTPSEEVKLGGIALTDVLDGLLARTGQTLNSVRDMESAKAAVKSLKMINDDFDDLIYHIPKLSPEGQMEMADAAYKAMPTLQHTVASINESPAMSDILGEQMNLMYEKLGAIATGNAGTDVTE